MKLIGITGGVGAGKSQLLDYIGKHYASRIYLADEVAHLVQEPGQPCYEKMVALLGEEILTETGIIDKGKMAAKIFSQGDLLDQVNAIVHPAVKDYLLKQIELAEEDPSIDLVFIEAALLIECGYKAIVDEMWYIFASEDVRKDRLAKARGYSDEKIKNIMSSQLSEEAFRENCDYTIDNSFDLEFSFSQIRNRLCYLGFQDRCRA